MATRRELVGRLDTLAVTLWNHGAEFAVPALEEFETGALRFAIAALLPGPPPPAGSEIDLTEVWSRDGRGRYRLTEYAYDFVERPLGRRRAFHRHDEAWFLERFAVAVHEHCEEVIGAPECSHYLGLPIGPFEALRRFMVQWGQSDPLGCDALPCMT